MIIGIFALTFTYKSKRLTKYKYFCQLCLLCYMFYCRCYEQLIRFNGALLRANGGYADVYHIPHHRINDYAVLAEFFARHRIFLEIAVPTIVRCLETESDLEEMRGIKSFDIQSGEVPWRYLTPTALIGMSYLHRTKWGYIEKGSQNYTQFFCKALSYVFAKYSEATKTFKI